MKTSLLVLTVLIGMLTGCSQYEAIEKTTDEKTSPQAATEGAFCREHGVLEAVCTKCNPALIPVFKAKGDWCEEHGFPESICPICHPERGGLPQADVADDGTPADGTRIKFKTKETARLAGLELAKVAEIAGDSTIAATVKIAYDASRVAQVNARSPGVIRTVGVEVGTRIRVGSPLAVIESAALSTDQSRVQAARSRLQVADANLSRATRLNAIGAISDREVLAARQELEAARADLASGEAALAMVGGMDGVAPRYTVTSPIAGMITKRNATVGRLVGTEEILFEVVDTSVMWAEIDIPEMDLSRVAEGQKVSLDLDGTAGHEFSGTLSFISPEIDPHTRTAKGRVPLANRDGMLRANMFGRAAISARGTRKAFMVLRTAVQRAKAAQFVYVRIAEDQYEARRVRVEESEGDLVEVVGRISHGDDIVTEGSFLLKTETLKGSIGAGCCDVEEPR